MSDQHVPALRRRFLEDMRIKGLQPKTQTMYLRAMREFTKYLGHSPDTAMSKELRSFQLKMKDRGVGAPTFNSRLTVLSFFFATTCPRCQRRSKIRPRGGTIVDHPWRDWRLGNRASHIAGGCRGALVRQDQLWVWFRISVGPCFARGDSWRRSSPECWHGGSAGRARLLSGVLNRRSRSTRRTAGSR